MQKKKSVKTARKKPVEEKPETPKPQKKKFLFWLIAALSLVIIGLLGYLFKEQFIVGTVNGKPIFRHQLNQRLTQAIGKETLENMIVEELINQEAKKENIVVGEKEIDEEVAKISQSLGEETKIEDVLAFQGLNMKDFRDQLRIRLQVNKLLGDEVEISKEEIDEFVGNNAESLTATDEAGKREEAQEIIREQKIGQKLQTWLSDLMANAQITRFLK